MPCHPATRLFAVGSNARDRNQGAFNSEVCLHFPGLENLDKPAVFTYPKIVVCLDCGHAEFSMPENELPSLVEGRYLRLAENSLAKGDPSLGC
jgi:hypothetical protein